MPILAAVLLLAALLRFVNLGHASFWLDELYNLKVLPGATLAQWRSRGHDTNSLIADPLFVAPEKNDFRLKRKSPAFKLGFKPIDVSTVGVHERR